MLNFDSNIDPCLALQHSHHSPGDLQLLDNPSLLLLNFWNDLCNNSHKLISRELFKRNVLSFVLKQGCLNSYSLITIILYHHLWGDRDRSERHHKECWLSQSLVMFPEIKMYRKKLKMLSLIGKPPKGA